MGTIFVVGGLLLLGTVLAAIVAANSPVTVYVPQQHGSGVFGVEVVPNEPKDEDINLQISWLCDRLDADEKAAYEASAFVQDGAERLALRREILGRFEARRAKERAEVAATKLAELSAIKAKWAQEQAKQPSSGNGEGS